MREKRFVLPQQDCLAAGGGGGVSGMSGVCLWCEFTFQRFKSATQRDEIKQPPSSNFRGRTVGPTCQVFHGQMSQE